MPKRIDSRTRRQKPIEPKTRRQPELGRGERVLSGAWRLRLPLPWPDVPHVNAWAVKADGGFVLFDTGLYGPGSIQDLERALEMCGLKIEEAKLVVCTHAHADHYGQAGSILDRAGCELWMHPRHKHITAMLTERERETARRLEMARDAGAPAAELDSYEQRLAAVGLGVQRVVEPDVQLLDGVRVPTALGDWVAYETPGHAPSHVCLFQPQRRLLISGDHLLGRISQHFDYSGAGDPIGEFVSSLDVVQALDARLCLAGHGRTFTDVRAHIDGNRQLLAERLQRASATVQGRPLTAYEVMGELYETKLSDFGGPFALYETLASLHHLAASGRVRREPGEPERWLAH